MQVIRGDDYQSWIYANSRDLIVVDPWFTKKQVFPKINWLLNRESTQEAYLIKNKLIEVNTTLKFEDKEEVSKKSYFEITYATIVKISEEVKTKEEYEKILLCDVQIKICSDIKKSFLYIINILFSIN